MKSLYAFFQWLWLFIIPSIVQGQVGTTAPDFTGTDTNGETHTLYEYLEAGKVVVLDFYYTTCTPCQFYSPQVNLAYEKYGCNTANVIFLSIDYDDTSAEVMAYDEEYHIPFPSISGLNGGGNAIVSAYQIIGFPTFYVIDSSKKIIDQIDPPTLQVFDFRFHQHGIEPADCMVSAVQQIPRRTNTALYPNPVADNEYISVKLPASVEGQVRYEIFNFTGVCVHRGNLDLDNAQTGRINPDNLVSGNYLVKMNPVQDRITYTASFTKI